MDYLTLLFFIYFSIPTIFGQQIPPPVWPTSPSQCETYPGNLNDVDFDISVSRTTLDRETVQEMIDDANLRLQKEMQKGCADVIRDVAKDKPVKMSSIYDNHLGKYAVDGDLGTYSHTGDSDYKPWLTVDLMQPFLIQEVQILPFVYPLENYQGLRYTEVEVTVGNHLNSEGYVNNGYSMGTFVGPYGQTLNNNIYITYAPSVPLMGQYITVRKVGSYEFGYEHLEILDMKVIAKSW